MSRKPSTDLEHSSEIPTWIVLICSGLALLMFFGWIAKDMSVRAPSEQAKGLLAQPLSRSGVASDNSAETIELANNQTIRRASSDNDASSKVGNGSRDTKGSPAPDSTEANAVQSTQKNVAQVPAESLKSRQLSPGTVQQPAKQNVGERASNQQHVAELPATDQIGQLKIPMDGESTAGAINSQSRTKQASSALSDSDTTESARTETFQEAAVSEDQAREAALPSKSTVQTDKAGQPAGSTLKTTSNQIPNPSADLGALRQLLAEAAAINETVDEPVRTEHDELESLTKLSTAIQFAPGSKVATESVTSALKEIQRILADYPETTINVIVASNETGNKKQDTLLSQERGRALIAKLVNGGLAFSRFSLTAQTDDQLPENTHRVEIQAQSKS